MVTYAVRLPKPVIDQLRAIARARNIKVSTLMREWLEGRLARESHADQEVSIPVSAILALHAERGAGRPPRASGPAGPIASANRKRIHVRLAFLTVADSAC